MLPVKLLALLQMLLAPLPMPLALPLKALPTRLPMLLLALPTPLPTLPLAPPTRLLMLPHESHGYIARESVEHVLAETIAWFDVHVKNAGPRPAHRRAQTRSAEGWWRAWRADRLDRVQPKGASGE